MQKLFPLLSAPLTPHAVSSTHIYESRCHWKHFVRLLMSGWSRLEYNSFAWFATWNSAFCHFCISDSSSFVVFLLLALSLLCLSLSLCLCLCLPVSVYLSLSLYLSVSVGLCVCLFSLPPPSFSLCVSLSLLPLLCSNPPSLPVHELTVNQTLDL